MEELVSQSKKSVVRGMERILKTFSFVSDEKLTWQASPSAKSALRIVAHCACANEGIAKLIEYGKFPPMEPAEFFASRNAAEEAITTRADAERMLRTGTDEILAALDGMTLERSQLMLDTPFGTQMPMAFFMSLGGYHCEGHASQIDFIQTCWGDQENHF